MLLTYIVTFFFIFHCPPSGARLPVLGPFLTVAAPVVSHIDMALPVGSRAGTVIGHVLKRSNTVST